MFYHITVFWGAKIFLVLAVEKQTTKHLPTKVNQMQCATSIMHKHSCKHVITLLISKSQIQPYFNTSREKKNNLLILMDLQHNQYHQLTLQLPIHFSLALKLFPKFSIPDPFVLVVALYHGFLISEHAICTPRLTISITVSMLHVLTDHVQRTD